MSRISNPWMKIKIGDSPEIDTRSISPGFFFLDDDENPTINNEYQDLSGVDGSILNYTSYGRNLINARFLLKFKDWSDYKLAKHDIFRTFSQKGLIRIRTNVEPAIVKFVRASSFEIEPIDQNRYECEFTIPFENPSGYKYSYLTSDNPYLYETEGWQIGMNLPNGEDLNYHFTDSNMRVYNASDIAVDPYFQRHQLKIIIKFSGSSLQLVNQTNGSSWKYLSSSNGKQTIVLDGINTSLDGAPASANTDFGNLTLEPGWNDIVAIGATTLDVTFSFPFIYIG